MRYVGKDLKKYYGNLMKHIFQILLLIKEVQKLKKENFIKNFLMDLECLHKQKK